MKKILFLSSEEKSKLINEINERLETKNRLLKLIVMNLDKKTSVLERRKKQTRYEEQVYLLENLKGLVLSGSSREDIQRINSMIDYYQSID